ncbi:phosphoribosyl-AMP cyclohydrolase [Modicisalibacter ilicicola DSM 19980]|uniref:Phosphoribosyl-AMP cyclohydrolase n=1 Tax=Modicisalibacter ilicicola DSM 19980 TaxID=1121942 RepID=A0A1M4XHB2_9GAMM|nr:phosphoribosyl-AMP cyclohydrolase [Halomonas ilicicola]SHE92703.1 phosphoribosyl-AMP cyclohydrolase [Halomonas ilicicola DSM 19980]
MSDLFKSLEKAEPGTRRPLSSLLDAVRWNPEGLIPAIAQQHDSGEVLMMAWMNRQSLEETLRTGRVCYWSRSRGKLWRKGESSGQEQHLRAAHLDCDGDTLLLQVAQTGPACHTGRRSCFYVALEAEHGEVDVEPIIDPDALYGPRG